MPPSFLPRRSSDLNEAYFSAVAQALEAAERSILLIGWQFDPRTRLRPEGADSGLAGEVGHLLRRLVREKPDLDVRLLIWRSPLPIALSQDRKSTRLNSSH